MTTKIDDGGPAFPVPIAAHASGDTVPAFDWGMSLRDWFAGQALVGLMAATAHPESGGPSHSYGGNDGLARTAYALADAMLAAKARPVLTGGTDVS